MLVTINVPANAPIDAVLPTAESKAANVIERSRVLGGRRVTGHWEKVRSGEAGRRIVDEAEEINARAIVFPLKRRRLRFAVLAGGAEGALRAPVPSDPDL